MQIISSGDNLHEMSNLGDSLLDLAFHANFLQNRIDISCKVETVFYELSNLGDNLPEMSNPVF